MKAKLFFFVQSNIQVCNCESHVMAVSSKEMYKTLRDTLSSRYRYITLCNNIFRLTKYYKFKYEI